MSAKIVIFGLTLMMLTGSLLSSAELHNNETGNTSPITTKDVRVAIYTDENEDARFYGPYGRTRYFVWALKDYDWQVGPITYRFVPKLISTKDILQGQLTTNNFDAMIYPPDTFDEYVFGRAMKNLPKNKVNVREIKKFVENGGGYFGSCGGALVAGDILNTPDTFFERVLQRAMIGISCCGVYFDGSIPLLCQFAGKPPDTVGPTPVHLIYSGFNQSNDNLNYHAGVCLDVPVLKDNPIFDDYLEETRRVRWLGAPNYEIPDNPNRNISVLATFPAEDMSTNGSTQNHYWKYVGGIHGLIKGAIQAMLGQGKVQYWDNLGFLMRVYCLAGDWEMQNTLLVTNFSGKPFWTAETYPNENEARIVKCTGHPEHNVWWGGHIVEEDTDDDTLYEGLYHWEDIIPENQTIEDEFSYNYWTLRRSIAWAAKVPDNDLPPIYGASQVSDVYPYNQSSNFTVTGNVKGESAGIITLDLYFRYSADNASWSDWTSYGTDIGSSDGWHWEFNASRGSGTGYYEFYSIRHVQYEDHIELETAPPGPDAIAYVRSN